MSSAKPSQSGRATGSHWLLVGLLAVALVALYGDVLQRLWIDWQTDDNYTHGLLVLPAMAWLLWRRRAEFRAAPAQPSWVGAVIVAGSLGVFVFGLAALEFFLTRLSIVGVLAGLIVQLWGWHYLRLSAFPLLLLALAIPLPALIFNEIAFPMQLMASQVGVAALGVLDVPVIRAGNVISLDRVTLEVAEACSGVRSLISLGTLALFYGHVRSTSGAANAIVLFSVVPIVILANGLRVAGAGVAAHLYGPEAATGFLHSFSGWLFFVVAGALIVAVAHISEWRWPGPSGRRPDWTRA